MCRQAQADKQKQGKAHEIHDDADPRGRHLVDTIVLEAVRSSLVVVLLAACGGSPSTSDDGGVNVDGNVTTDGASALGLVLYPSDRTLSPLTPELVAQLRAVHATSIGSDAVFAKIGDSHTVSTSFLACFAGSNVDLDGRDLAATVAHFKTGDAAGTTPYQRVSLAATVGWSAGETR